jgi:methyl-accepting chemotaxis protein
MTENLLTVFVGLAALAIIIQMGVLIALLISSRKASERLQRVSKEMEENLLPMIRDTKILLAEATPKVREVLDNLAVLSATARQDAERFSSTANEITDRVREQVVRADELVTHTLNRAEETTETVQQVIRQISGVMTGVAAGLAEFLGSRKLQRQKNARPRDEMFI